MKTEKHTTKHKRMRSPAFSLVELMTVVSIMAILTAVASPGLKIAMINAQQNAAMGNARSIAMGLRTYAQDYEGAFPGFETDEGETISTSNDAFRLLLPDYIDSERVFAVKRSAWGKKADGRIDEPEDRLRAGENHFAYIAGLLDTSRTDWPLVVDGTDGSGKYTSTNGVKGGCWEGRKGIVVTVGGSGHVYRMSGDGDSRFIPRYGYPDENALDVGSYMGEIAQLLDPE
ncbi:MAG: type II secretion system protein [Verrucomicrobiales bacterium]|nr:type II secretion system protein [Verrucomicrobiales bacterium]